MGVRIRQHILEGVLYSLMVVVMLVLHHYELVSLDTSFVIICVGLAAYGAWLIFTPSAYRQMVIDERGVTVVARDDPDIAFLWKDVSGLTFLGHEPRMEELSVTLRDGTSHIIPFEIPDRTRFLRAAAQGLRFEPMTPGELRRAAAGGAWTLWCEESDR